MQLEEKVTEWLRLWREGDPAAIDQVMEAIYRDLRRMAAYFLAGERNAQTLQPTALVHETFLRLAPVREFDWKGRGQFISVVAQIMRRVLVDQARARSAAKRTPALIDPPAMNTHPLDLLVVDEALTDAKYEVPTAAGIAYKDAFGDWYVKMVGGHHSDRTRYPPPTGN